MLTPPPGHSQWSKALLRGFRPNGATFSPDTIYGVRIGRKTDRFSLLPANVHDYRYFVGGDKDDRYAADREFLRTLRKTIATAKMPEPFHTLAYIRCLWYYTAVRFLGPLFFRWSDNGFWDFVRALFGK